jgi:polysaccharide transporter, PST family
MLGVEHPGPDPLRSQDLPSPSLFTTAVRSGVWSFLEGSSRHWINLAVMIVLARLLGPAAFGIVAIASAYIVITDVVVRGGLPEYVIKHQAQDERVWTTIFWANTVLAVIIIGLTWLIATPAAWLFGVPELQAVLRALSVMLLVRALGATHEALVIRTFGFKALALRTLIASLVGGAVGIGMALSGFGVWSLVGERLGNSLSQTVLVWLAARWRPKLDFSWALFLRIWPFGRPLTLSRLLSALDNYGQDFVIGTVLGPQGVGFYRVAMQLQTVIIQLSIVPLTRVALPSFARLQDEPARLADAYVQTAHVAALTALPLFFGGAVVAPDILTLVFGSQWQPAVLVMQILCLAAPLHAVLYFYEPALIGVGRTRELLHARIVQTSSGLGSAAAAAPFGVAWVAAGNVLRMALVAVYVLRLLERTIKVPVRRMLLDQGGPLVAAVAMAAGILLLRWQLEGWSPLPLLLISVAVGALLYGALVLLFLPHSRRLLERILRSLAPGRQAPDIS